MPLRTWSVSADWVIHSQEYNEWMVEQDYEVDDGGKKLVHRHRMSVDSFFNERRITTTSREESHAQSSASTSSARRLPKTQCPECGISITSKVLKRHLREQHANISEEFKCNLCEFATKREDALLDHQRRKHYEPVTMGRPKKNDKRRRKRSPFRTEVFENRHTSTIQSFKLNLEMKEALELNSRKLDGIEKVLEETKIVNKKNDVAISKIKTRVSIVESKQPQKKLPEVDDIPGLLEYFNLNENSTKEDIRKTINLRLVEASCESVVSHDVFLPTKLTVEEKQLLTMKYNEASQVLMKWKNKQKKQ